jgi:hypothetical protein
MKHDVFDPDLSLSLSVLYCSIYFSRPDIDGTMRVVK